MTDNPRLQLRIDGSHVHGKLEGFPVRVEMAVPFEQQQYLAGGVRVRDAAGVLPSRLVVDADSGRIAGWVEVRRLAPGEDTVLDLELGAEPGADGDTFAGCTVFHDGSAGHMAADVPDAGIGQFLVEGWLRVDEARAEAVQVVSAQWDFAEGMTGFATHDAGATDGLQTQGFFGAVFDGRHVYFSPQCNNDSRHGQALRYDTQRAFDDPAAWEGYDAGATDDLVTRGFYGCLFDGRYVYYVPRTDGEAMHSRVLRYDTTGAFREPASWSAYDAGDPVSSQGGACDGRYIYFAPGYHAEEGHSGRVLRYDTTGQFDDPSSWVRYDASGTDGLTCTCYDGTLYDGRHVYFAPLDGGAVLRHDPTQPFDQPRAWEAFDPHVLPGDPFGMCVGAVFDGRWIYFTPYAHDQVVRHDTEGAFADPASWEVFGAGAVDGLHTRGYDGAAFDGRWIYFIPFWEGDDPGCGFHARVLRYDTTRPFSEGASWQAADGGALAPPNPGGFNGGAFDGRFLYMAPWRRDEASGEIRAHGEVLRLDTAGPAARFQLRLVDCGHNGGLGGSVPGPSLLVNGAEGPVSAQAHTVPGAGWHHIAGVYGEDTGAQLWIDGERVATAPWRGAPVAAAGPVTVGGLPGGGARPLGQVQHVRLRPGPIADGWVRTAYENLRDPAAFATLQT